MSLIDENFDEFPQHLCKMCGKCCRAIITPYSYEELVELANEGQNEAKVFIEVFKKYDSIDDAKKAVPDHVQNVLNELKKDPNFDESKVSFYYCPHLNENNLCSIHDTRPDCCRRAPRNGWSLFPPDCGFKGWQFQQRERVKFNVRKLKETLLDFELLNDDTILPTSNITVREAREKILEKIALWDKYGATYW